MAAFTVDDDTVLIRQAGLTVIALHLAYAAATIAGFMELDSADNPIADPWFATMEVLIILLAPPVIIFLCALRRIADAKGKAWVAAAVALTAMTFALSASLHAIILAIGRDHPLVGEGGLLAFNWPSVAYAIDILAWDGFFAIALICCAMGLRTVAGMTFASRTFLAAGVVALAGISGPLAGSMALRNVGIVGYAVIFPLAVAMLVRALPRVRSA